MDKIYIAWETWEGYGEHREDIRGIFRTKEEAEAMLEEWRHVSNVIGEDEACLYYMIEERTVSEYEAGSCYPKKLAFNAKLIGDGNKVEVKQLYLARSREAEEEGDIHFIPYNGRIRGLIDFIPEESHEEHMERAQKMIEDNLKKIVPQEVLEAKVKKAGSPFLKKLGREIS